MLPRLLQLKVAWLITLLVMVQLSVLALSNIVGLIKALPFAFKYTVTLALGRATGATGSNTTTLLTFVFTFPFTSVTVKVTGVIPI